MKNKLLYVILVVAAFLGVQGFAAEVTNVELSYADGSTVAKIHVDGTVRFTHQTEEAKDGKPFRVIVDVLSATHELGAKNFMRLPDCSVERLRTSQYSVKPEQIVRLVFDMHKETFYSINSDERSVTVSFPDKSHQPFTAWSSRSVVKAMKAEKKEAPKVAAADAPAKASTPANKPAAKTTVDMNKSIEKDRQASLAATTPAPSQTKAQPVEKSEPVVKAETKRAEVPYKARNSYGPAYDPELLASAEPVKEKPVVAAKPEVEETTPAVTKPVVTKAEPKKEAAPVTKPAVSEQTTTPAKSEPKPAVKKTTPAVKPEATKKPVMAKAQNSSKTTQAQKPAPAKKAQQDKKPMAKQSATVASKPAPKKTETTTVATKPKKESKTSTSRFRRSAADKKVKGTMVAEFPKRLVIKYKSRSTRDPFETLVNETRVNNSVIERSVPNVEGLTLVGVIESDGGDNSALFEDNSGYGYILKSGDKVRKGYVLRVESDRVYFQIFEYGWSRTVALNLEEN